MKAISIRQPWAWLIIRPDITDPAERAQADLRSMIKDIENRSRASRHCGPLLIHASKSRDLGDYRDALEMISIACRDSLTLPAFEDLDRGGIIGRVNMLGCAKASTSRWFVGEHGYVLANAEPLPFRAYKGQLGIFEVPD
ncbi:MAG: hypothetical protein ABIY63_13220 [Fibrobacteria bacterium]